MDREQQAAELNRRFLAARAAMGCHCVMMGVTWNAGRKVFDFNHEELWHSVTPELADASAVDLGKWAAEELPWRCRQIADAQRLAGN